MKKKILSTLLLVGTLSTNVFAAQSIAIDGTTVENSSVINVDGNEYISVRPLAEALGLDIEWRAATKTVILSDGGPLYVTFSIGKNGYTFAKTAPMPLSGAPVIRNGMTYVPADIITEVLGYKISDERNRLNIITESESKTEAVTAIGTVTEVSDDEILFNDENRGEVRLNKSDAVEVVDENGNSIDINSIAVDAKLQVEYGNAMTMSIPPLNNPIKIVVLSNEVKAPATGVVTEISEDEILFKDNVIGDVRLNRSSSVKVSDTNGNDVDINSIKVGNKLNVNYSDMMTKSIPPLNTPISITIVE